MLLVFLLLASAYPLTVLEVVRGRTGEILYQCPVQVGEEFKLTFIHSVTLRPVEETYRVTSDHKIAIVEMVFDDSGPNLPAYPEGSTRWIIEKNRWRVVGYDTLLEEISLLVAQHVADHTLLVGGRKVSLVKTAGPGQYVRIRAARISLIGFVWRGGSTWLNRNR
ncbi:MAG: DUF1850 domain-containing protein [Bacillota bacterium]